MEKLELSPVIVIGMHRSGTSMLTRFISESGIFMGSKKSMGKNEESFFFQKINNWILYQKNITWDNPYNLQFSYDFINQNIVHAVRKRLESKATRTYFGGKYNPWGASLLKYSKSWGWKDPRNTLTMDIWSAIYPEAKVVHIYRNPIDVANSLLSRESRIKSNFKRTMRIKNIEKHLIKKPCYSQSLRVQNIEEGIKLWEEYTEEALKAETFFKSVIHIAYEDLIVNPAQKLIELSEFLGLDINDKIINSIVSQLKTDRNFAFVHDSELIKTYNRHKNNPLFEKLSYSHIV